MVLAEKREYKQSFEKETTKNQQQRKRKVNFNRLIKVGGMVFCLLIINILIQALVIQKNYQARALESQIRDVNREMVEVRMDIANLESLDRIKMIAQNDLGMREAGSSDYRCIAVANTGFTDGTQGYQTAKSKTLWAKVSSWFGGMGATMAKN